LPLSSAGRPGSKQRAATLVAAQDDFQQIFSGGVRQLARAEIVEVRVRVRRFSPDAVFLYTGSHGCLSSGSPRIRAAPGRYERQRRVADIHPDSIANTASNVSGWFAPNTFITIYGKNLAYSTRAISADDLHGLDLPTALIGTGVRVLVNNIAANIFYVSPTQVNLLVPSVLIAGPATIQLVVDGSRAGNFDHARVGRAFAFSTRCEDRSREPCRRVARHRSFAGACDEEIVLYATGLESRSPRRFQQVAQKAAPLAQLSDFRVLLNGVASIEADSLCRRYSWIRGTVPDNVLLPSGAPSNPEIRVGFGDNLSPPALTLPVQ